MQHKSSEIDHAPTEVKTIITDTPVNETGVLLILESILLPLLKQGLSVKKQLKVDNKKSHRKSGQLKSKIKNTGEIHTLPAQSFKESA